ncbi:Tetratricopeptide repeat protein 25, partial [Chytridiales sp. JEL 0842]
MPTHKNRPTSSSDPDHQSTLTKLDPKSALFLFQSLHAEADKLANSHLHDEAIDRYTRALTLHSTFFSSPDSSSSETSKQTWILDCLVNRSRCYMLLGQTTQALKDVNKALEIDSTFIRAVFQKAEVLYAKGDFEDAL